jgi:hypothetical protein
VTLNSEHRFLGNPVVVPSPGIELGLFAAAQANVAFAADQPQQEPDLFLPAIITPQVASDPLLGNLVSHPLPRARHDAHMLRGQSDLFVQLAVHRLLGGLAVLDPPLRELPGMLLCAFSPEYLVTVVEQDDADIRAVAFLVQHAIT